MKRNVIIDASVLAALLNKNDTYHQWTVIFWFIAKIAMK
jgi:predicted nucleic acid-binding protein